MKVTFCHPDYKLNSLQEKIKNNQTNPTLIQNNNIQGQKSNFGLYDTSLKYGISFGRKKHKNQTKPKDAEEILSNNKRFSDSKLRQKIARFINKNLQVYTRVFVLLEKQKYKLQEKIEGTTFTVSRDMFSTDSIYLILQEITPEDARYIDLLLEDCSSLEINEGETPEDYEERVVSYLVTNLRALNKKSPVQRKEYMKRLNELLQQKRCKKPNLHLVYPTELTGQTETPPNLHLVYPTEPTEPTELTPPPNLHLVEPIGTGWSTEPTEPTEPTQAPRLHLV